MDEYVQGKIVFIGGSQDGSEMENINCGLQHHVIASFHLPNGWLLERYEKIGMDAQGRYRYAIVSTVG